MDTTWFAVDRDGAVAVFSSGEPGLVPAAVTGQFDNEIEALSDTLPVRGDATLDLAFAKPPGLRAEAFPLRRKAPLPTRGDRVAFVARDASTIERAFAKVAPSRRSTQDALEVVEIDGCLSGSSDPRVDAWREAFAEIRRSSTPILEIAIATSDIAWARAGLFVYKLSERIGDADPYGRVLVPTSPLQVGELGPQIASRLGSTVRLDLSFRESPYVQPAEHLPCVGWDTAIYLASDGFTIRPLPGRSKDYEEHAICVADHDDDRFEPLVFDPPIGEDQ